MGGAACRGALAALAASTGGGTAPGRKAAVRAAVGAYAGDCPEAFAYGARQLPAAVRDEFADSPIEITEIEEDSAEGRAMFGGRSIALLMRVEDGEWRIANLPGQ